jgi:hypothetical protein
MGQTRKSGDTIATSALPLIADIRRAGWDVRPVPTCDIRYACFRFGADPAAIAGSPSALDKIVGKLAVHCVAERTNEAARRQI